MEQNNMWKRYLTTGLIISIIALIMSCDYNTTTQTGNFYFVNETDYNITFPKGFEKYNIAPRSVITVTESIRSDKKKSELSDYVSPLIILNGELTIKFDNLKCLVNQHTVSMHSITEIENYVPERIDDRTFKFTYTFTEADYNRAVTCK